MDKIMEEMIGRNDFDPQKALAWAAETAPAAGLGDAGFAAALAGSVCADGERFAIGPGEEEKTGAVLCWRWHRLERAGDVLFLACLQNVSGRPVVLSDLRFTAEYLPLAGQADAAVYRWHSWDLGVEKLADGSFYSENLLHISSAAAGRAFLCGALTLSRMKVKHTVEKQAGRLQYGIGMDLGEYTLPAGACFCSEIFCAAEYDDPYRALEDWAQKVHDLYQPQLPLEPPVGWVGGWQHKDSDETAEQAILRNLHAIRRRLDGFGVEYIWTSQSNLPEFTPGNWLDCNLQEYPDGLRAFCDRQTELGFKPGFWVAPFWFYSEAAGMYEKNEAYLLRDKNGEPICEEEVWGWKYEDDDRPWYHMHKYYLDGTHPEGEAYLRRIYAYYRSIGARYFMLDFLMVPDRAAPCDGSQTPLQAACRILRGIREAAGPDTHLLTAVSGTPAFIGTINSARVGRDFGECRCLEGFGALDDWRTATNVLHDENYANEKYLIRNASASWFTHQKIYQASYNCLTVDKPYPVSYVQIETTLFGMAGSNPVMLGDNIADISDERLKYIKLILPRTPFSAVPADLFDRVQPQDECRLMKLPVHTDWDDYLLVAAYNTDDAPCDLTLDFAKLGLSGQQAVYDFWNEEYRGIFRGSFPVHLAANSCQLLRLSARREHPWLIGTDMHIQQGAAEIESLHWDEETMTLTGCAVRPAGEQGTLTILMPRDYRLKNSRREIHLLKELEDYRILLNLPLRFGEEGRAEFRLEFERWEYRNLSPKGHIPYADMEELKAYMAAHYTRESTRVFD